jgi:hypothetical protein
LAELEFPTWTGSGGPADSAWRTCILGDVRLPGIVTVTGLSCGIDVKTKKSKGQDGVTSTDNGVEPSKFAIEVWLNERTWPEWLKAVPKIHPRRPGRQRQPVEIKHPEPNVLGITHIRILKLTGTPPTARGGKKYRIEVEEWFDEPKPVKKKPGKEVPKHTTTQDYYGDPNELARRMAQTQGYILPPDDPDNISTQLY